jgi:hypothetical protein
MNHRSFALTSLAAVLAASALGCAVTAKSTERFEGDASTETVDWTSGTDLQIDARNGTINVEPGDSGAVRVTFLPFSYRGYDEEAEAQREMEDSLTATAELGDSGVEVTTAKTGGGSSSLGADIVVELPPEFDAGIFIRQGNGDVDINAVGDASQLVVHNDGVGDCFVDGAPSLQWTEVWCSGVSVRDVSDYVNLQADGVNGNIFCSLYGISGDMPAGEDRSILYTEDGDVVLDLPSDDGFVVEASTFGDGSVVNEGPVPDECDLTDDSASSKTVTCGDGPKIDIQAGLEELGEGNVELRYH